MFKILTKSPIFIGLTPEEIDYILNSVRFQVKKYSKDEMVAMSGDKIISQLVLLEGSVKGEMVDFTGKSIKIEDIEAPRPLAPAFLFGEQNAYPVNIVTNEKTAVLVIPKNSFIKMMQMNEIVLNNFLGIISNRAQFLSNKIKLLSFQTIKGKLAHYLLQLSKRTGNNQIVLDKTQHQLSELFGVTRPSLGRTIREMNNEGLIDARSRTIKILNPIALAALIK